MNTPDLRTQRIASAALGTALTLIAYYALDRSRAAIFDPGPDPAVVMASAKVEYFWRVSICAYASPLVFAGWFFAAGGREALVWRIATASTIPVSLIAAALAVVFP